MSSDHLNHYFAQIRRYKQLTKAEESYLLARVRAMNLYPNDLMLRAMGLPARAKLVRHNLKLVVSIAKKVRRQCGSLTFRDLIFYGNEGLIKAIDEKIDLSRGRFSTGAYPFIWQAVMSAIYWESRDIRVPAHAWRTKTKLSKSKARLQTELKREPTVAEVLEDSGISRVRYEANKEAFHSFCELLPETQDLAQTPEAESLPDELKVIRETFACLRQSNRRAYRVLELLFGMNGVTLTPEEISERLGISVKEVRGYKRTGLAVMREMLQPGTKSDTAIPVDTWFTAA